MTANLQIPPEFDRAPKTEKIAFVEELWDRIAKDSSDLPISSEHKRILDERLKSYEQNPNGGTLWNEARDGLIEKYRTY